MGTVFLYLLFHGMDLGDLLCIGLQEEVCKQRIYERAPAADLRQWSPLYSAGERTFPGKLPPDGTGGNGGRHGSGIYYGSSNGGSFPGTLLGLQR